MLFIVAVTVVMLVSSTASSLSSFCITDQLTRNIECICEPHDQQPRYLKLSSFEEAAIVTIANCKTVIFNGGYSYVAPPSVIQFVNIVDLHHQLDLSIWPPVNGKPETIKKIEFLNVGTIHELHLNELFPINHVELLLFNNVSSIKKIASRTKPIYNSFIDDIRFINSRIVELMTGSFVLMSPKLFSIENGTFISHWKKEAVNATNGEKFVLTNSTVNHMENGAIVGSFTKNIIINSNYFNRIDDLSFNELSKINRVHIFNNVFKIATPMTFKRFLLHSGIMVNFSSNSLPCEKLNAAHVNPVANPKCLGRVSKSKTISYNYCYPNPKLNFNDFYSVHCDNLSRIFSRATQIKLSQFATFAIVLISVLL
ncbi:hypothetical protein CHUAL_006633 [Chamberlinius hualienensis]